VTGDRGTRVAITLPAGAAPADAGEDAP